MILSNVSVPLLGMVDTAVMGHLDSPVYLGAVAIGSALFGFLYVGLNFLRMGTTGIAAQRFGANDFDGIRTTLGQALVVANLIAFALIALQIPIGSLAITVMGGDSGVRQFAGEYFHIRIWSAPATLSGYALIGWFIGLQNARVPLTVILITNAVNIVLDLWFVIGLGMKVDGVAMASVIAEYTGLAVALVFVWRELTKHPGNWQPNALTRVSRYKAFIAINSNLFIRTMALVATFTFVTAQGSRMGGLVLAANAVLMNFQNLLAFALDGLAHAAEALVGKAVGAKNNEALKQSVRISLRWSLLVAIGFCVFFWALGPVLIRLLTDLADVQATTLEYLPWLIASPLVSVWSYLYDGVFVGATRAREMRNIMVVSAAAVFLPAWYFLQPLGNHGLWFAFMLFMASRGIGMHLYYRARVGI